MRKYLLVFLVILSFESIYSQKKYDLIIKINGDSVACFMDSITDTDIYFRMKFDNKWIPTYTSRSSINYYKANSIERNTVLFKPGSSIIEKSNIIPQKPKNNFNIGFLGDASLISANFDFLFYLNDKFFLSAKLGIGFNQQFQLFNKSPENFITFPHHFTSNIGFRKYFFEFGLGGTLIAGETDQHYIFYPMLGYRFQPMEINKICFRIFIQFPVVNEIEDIMFGFVGGSIGLSL